MAWQHLLRLQKAVALFLANIYAIFVLDRYISAVLYLRDIRWARGKL
jgi:hypothetical protein